jgi:RimJ/RimL family protein N-acetyltransferase
VCIRLANIADARAIAEVHVAAWRAAYSGHMPKTFLEALSVNERTSMWGHALKEPGPGTTLVIEHERQVVGFCVYGPSRDEDAPAGTTGELVAINLLPSHWRRGLGTAACSHILEQARLRKWSSLTLWVLKENVPARAFYERLGFVLDDYEKRDSRLVGVPLHEVRYRMVLG